MTQAGRRRNVGRSSFTTCEKSIKGNGAVSNCQSSVDISRSGTGTTHNSRYMVLFQSCTLVLSMSLNSYKLWKYGLSIGINWPLAAWSPLPHGHSTPRATLTRIRTVKPLHIQRSSLMSEWWYQNKALHVRSVFPCIVVSLVRINLHWIKSDLIVDQLHRCSHDCHQGIEVFSSKSGEEHQNCLFVSMASFATLPARLSHKHNLGCCTLTTRMMAFSLNINSYGSEEHDNNSESGHWPGRIDGLQHITGYSNEETVVLADHTRWVFVSSKYVA